MLFCLWFLCRCSKLSILFGGELSLTPPPPAPEALSFSPSRRLVADDIAEQGCV